MKQAKKLPFLFTLLLSLFSLSLFAQTATIKGTVKTDNTPLADAAVQLGRTGTTTNAQGVYSISLNPGKYTIVVSYTGYDQQVKNITLSAGETLISDFSLTASTVLNEVVVLGSRSTPRTQLETTVPIDVLDIKKLAGTGAQVNLNQILNFAAPSFTSNTQSLGDGTDHVDPASLRGLGPDQVLVLVNGKRRYNSALINVNGTFGRGSVGTDLNAIPVSSIERIEILRDGAAAQYGSDAIAGVINVVLKKTVNRLSASLTSGEYNTRSNKIQHHDGQNTQVALNFGLALGEKGGYINFSGSFDDRKPTDRGGARNDVIYRRYQYNSQRL
jgi:iron complex outermembrane receptor protein